MHQTFRQHNTNIFNQLNHNKFYSTPVPLTQQEAVKVAEAGAGKWDQINLLAQRNVKITVDILENCVSISFLPEKVIH